MKDAADEAFRHLFEREFESLFGYANRLTGDPATASDVAQEAFVRLYQRGSPPDDVRAWLTTVAVNLVRDRHRRSTRRRRLLQEHVDRVRDRDGPGGPLEETAARERRERARRALDLLPERQREALLLRHEGYAYREIAAALDYPVNGVGKLLVRATRAFRRAWEEPDEAPD